MQELKGKLLISFLILFSVLIFGTIGYVVIEKWTFFDALYMTVITIATVGYGETHQLHTAGRIFTIFLILFCVGTLTYAVSSITAFFVEGELQGYIRRKKMENKIKNLSEHYIICGAGNVGKYIIDELYKTNKKFVVVDSSIDSINTLNNKYKILYIEGNATNDEVLLKSGIKRAKGLISVLPSDKDNLFVVITGRQLNSNLKIVTKVTDEESIPKLYKAGADSVVSTDAIGGLRMASVCLRPTVVSFLDEMLRETQQVLRIEEVEVKENSTLIGKTIKEIVLKEEIDVNIIAIKNKISKEYIYNKINYEINKGDILIVIGNLEQIQKLNSLVKGD